MYVLFLHTCTTRCSASWSVLAVLSCLCGHKKIIEDPCEMGQRAVNKTSCAGLLSQCMQTGILDAASSAHSAPLRATLSSQCGHRKITVRWDSVLLIQHRLRMRWSVAISCIIFGLAQCTSISCIMFALALTHKEEED